MSLSLKIRTELDLLRSRREALLSQVAHLEPRLLELESALRVVEEFESGQSSEENTGAGDREAGGNEDENPRETDGKESETDGDEARTERNGSKPGRGYQKFLIEEALRSNWPSGLLVNDLQQWILTNRHVSVTTNTISVTLPRLDLAGLARKQGRQWFYVPPKADSAKGWRNANQERENAAP